MNYTPEQVAALGKLVRDDAEAERMLLHFAGIAGEYPDVRSDEFMAPRERGRTHGARLKQMKTALKHLDALLPLLDDRLAWMISCYLPGMEDGPEVSIETEKRIADLCGALRATRADMANAIAKLPVAKRGHAMELNPRLMLTLSLIGWLKEAGIPWAIGERSRMVQAIRVCWDVADIEGDPIDLLRTLNGRIAPAESRPRSSAKRKTGGVKVVPIR